MRIKFPAQQEESVVDPLHYPFVSTAYSMTATWEQGIFCKLLREFSGGPEGIFGT
jgi:hypothetical protein